MAKPILKFNPPILDLSLYAGDGSSFRIVVKDPTGVPIELTGTMKAQIRAERHADDPPLADIAIDLTDGGDGIIYVTITGEQTDLLAPSSEKFEGVWDLEWTATDVEPLTLCQGKVECFPDVTH